MNDYFWAQFVAAVGAVWAIITLVRDRRSRALAHTQSIMSRLLELDRMIIEHPDAQMFLSAHATSGEVSFMHPDLLKDAAFFKAKTLLYYQINLFDLIIASSNQTRRGNIFTHPPKVIEISDWEEYIKRKLSHPLCRCIMHNESHIFGRGLRDFWEAHRASIEAMPPDPFSW